MDQGVEVEYLGDSVYVNHDGFGLDIHLNNGEGPHTNIYMEPQVFQSLLTYIRRQQAAGLLIDFNLPKENG